MVGKRLFLDLDQVFFGLSIFEIVIGSTVIYRLASLDCDEKMGKDSEVEWRWRRECPRFSGVQAEYKGWRGQVADWLAVCEELVKYPGIEIRLSLRGRALEVTEGLDREKLKTKEGPKEILGKLDEVYLKDTLVENYGKMKRYLKIERESGEKMRFHN